MKSKVLKSLMLATLVLGASGTVTVIAESATTGTAVTTVATEVPKIELVKRQMNSDKDRLSLVFNRTNQKYSEASIGIFNEAGELVEGAYIYNFVSFKEGHNNTDQFINSINFKDGTYTAGVRWTEGDYLANDYDMATFTFTVKDGHFVDNPVTEVAPETTVTTTEKKVSEVTSPVTTEAKTETEVVPPVTTEAKTETEVVPPVTTESSMTTESSTREKTEKSTTVKPVDKTQIVTPKSNHISVDRTTDATTTSGERQPVEKTTQKPVVKEQKTTLPATGEKVTSVLTVLGMGILATVIFLGLKHQEK